LKFHAATKRIFVYKSSGRQISNIRATSSTHTTPASLRSSKISNGRHSKDFIGVELARPGGSPKSVAYKTEVGEHMPETEPVLLGPVEAPQEPVSNPRIPADAFGDLSTAHPGLQIVPISSRFSEMDVYLRPRDAFHDHPTLNHHPEYLAIVITAVIGESSLAICCLSKSADNML
jgi:hypothetical protein